MIPRLDIQFPIKRQLQFWFGRQYEPQEGEYLLNHARTGIVMALRATLPDGGKVGVVAYNCHTVANAVVNAGCIPVFVDVTEELTIDIESIPTDLDAIVVTNLFGIRNNVETIRKRCPHAVIIVDNAHGYGLPAEGDFTVYSINQGKFPALGEGGILVVNLKENEEKNIQNKEKNQENIILEETQKEESQVTCSNQHDFASHSAQEQALGHLDNQTPVSDTDKSYLLDSSEKNELLHNSQKKSKNIIEAIEEQYAALPSYGFVGEVKLFVQMMVKAIAYSRCCYWLVMKMKKSAKVEVHEVVTMRKMAPGVRRLYQAWLPSAEAEIAKQKRNAEKIDGAFYGENGFMAIVRCENTEGLKKEFAKRGVETETHFKHCIEWARVFGYIDGSCPNAEKLTQRLLMIPTYTKI